MDAKAHAAEVIEAAERAARELLAQAEADAERVRAEAIADRRTAEAARERAETSARRARDEAEQNTTAGRDAVERARGIAATIVAEAQQSAAVLREDAAATATRVRGTADTYAKRVVDAAEQEKQQTQEAVDKAAREAKRIVDEAHALAGDTADAAKSASEEMARAARAETERMRTDADAAADALRTQARTAATRITAEANRDAQAERTHAATVRQEADALRAEAEELRSELAEKIDRLRWRTNILGRLLPVVALLAAVALTASGEYHLYVWAGFGVFAAFGPVCIDAYVIAAFRRRREVGWAIGVMVLTNVTVHLLPVLPGGWVHIVIRIAVAGLAPVVLWRVHELLHDGSASRLADQHGKQAETLPAAPDSVPATSTGSAVDRASREAPATATRAKVVASRKPTRTPAPAAIAPDSGSRDHVAAALQLLRDNNGDVSYRAAQEALGCRYATAKDALDEAKRRYASGATVLTLPIQPGTTNA
ncbi:hypothetical protein LO772_24490 [Yinghuangia sp. ASG 101]|uniref:hypothetical protein n=1 Tax=Yinghuangia sp. ASG 101 TaxID=2896848 RepID=UPI001E596226|nr:hypothetical protein [Yinghuangia sp. ASG 101]UGQ10028.1 hypothetical protein LO772_24490 [Yinghuangia sp. ASG 101]